MDTNLISITLVAYNAEETIKKTLESISSQQYVNFEIIFVNDASTDKTLEIMQDFKESYPSIPCTVLTNASNLGITKSRNKALSYAKGSFIAVIDSDDAWTSPLKLKTQLDFLKSNPDFCVVGTQMSVIDKNHKVLKTTSYPQKDEDIRKSFLIKNQFCHSSVLVRKTVSATYDESLYIWEDYDLILKLGQEHKFANLPNVMVNYLYHKRNLSLAKKLKLISTELKIIKRYKDKYPSYATGVFKRVIKYILTLLNLK